ncbi:MAG: SpoIVB peptidase [Clostridiales bacterium]|nr:SpoIVB peptidase [Clostridiales bacterium]
MKGKIKFLSIIFALVLAFSCFTLNSAYAENFDNKLYLGGIPAGFAIQTRGAYIVGLCDVVTENGVISPSKDAGILVGDVIMTIDGVEINCAKDIENVIKNKKSTTIAIERAGENIIKNVSPAKDVGGSFKLGIFVKDDVCGIGTITFIKGNRFASLGHPVINEDGNITKIVEGNIFKCNVSGCVKGERGKPGELKGVFLKTNAIGFIDKNKESGVYGNISTSFDKKDLIEIDAGDAVMGDAEIYTTVKGNKPEKYDISIIKIDNENENKNFVIKIIDKRLLNCTNGIVQGMSGSPIVQNNKLVGAVTHVFINDPTRGFGISIDNMLNN